jgi:hypothetical protein
VTGGPRIGLLVVDRDQLSLRRGLLGVVAIFAVLLLLVAFGYAAIAAMLGALVTAVSAGAGPMRERMLRAGAVAVTGSLLTILGVWSGERGWTAAIVVGVVAFAAALASVFGREAATAGYMLTLWLLLSLTFTASSHSSGALAANFLAGGALVVLLQPLLTRSEDTERPTDGAAEGRAARQASWVSSLRNELSLDSRLFQFAVVRAGGIAGATLVGWYAFDAHSYWAAIVAFAITTSDPLELVAVGVHRAVGTIAGAAVAVELVRHVDSRPWLTAALVVASALGIAFSKANYAIFTFFMTALLSTQLVRGDAARAAGQRIWATLLGVLLAFVVTSLVLLVARRRTQAPRTRPDPGHP